MLSLEVKQIFYLSPFLKDIMTVPGLESAISG